MDRDDNLAGNFRASDRIGSRHGQGKAAFKTWNAAKPSFMLLATCPAAEMRIAANG